MKERTRRPPRPPAASPRVAAAIDAELNWHLDRITHWLDQTDTPFTTPKPEMSDEVRAEREAWKRLTQGAEAPDGL